MLTAETARHAMNTLDAIREANLRKHAAYFCEDHVAYYVKRDIAQLKPKGYIVVHNYEMREPGLVGAVEDYLVRQGYVVEHIFNNVALKISWA